LRNRVRRDRGESESLFSRQATREPHGGWRCHKDMANRRLEECAYCGGTDDLTAEHVPPKLIFPKPWPDDLITVPACRSCNQEGQSDAEYFRACLCVSPQTRQSEDVAVLRSTLQRSLERPQAAGFRQGLLDAMKPAGGKIAFDVEIERLHKVVERAVQCLYLHDTGRRLNEQTHEVFALGEDYLQQFSPEEIAQFQRDFIGSLSEREPTIIGNGTFAYAAIHTSSEFVSFWGLLFYGSFAFIALTGTRRRPLNRTPVKPIRP
jgi:hypothetical protein